MGFHRSQISNLEELADETISKGCHTVIPEYIANIPNIGDKIEVAIQELIDGTSKSTKQFKSLKRTPQIPLVQPQKRGKKQKTPLKT